jgi:hypothetical protein
LVFSYILLKAKKTCSNDSTVERPRAYVFFLRAEFR